MNVFNIPNNYCFLKSVIDFTLNKINDPLSLSKLTILLPSRRSCNELKRLFLEKSNVGAIILPKIQAIGDIDYDDIYFKKIDKNDLETFKELTSNTSRIKYKLLLIKELLNWCKLNNKILFKHLNIEQATNFALEFEKFINEVNKNQLTLNKLNDIVDQEYSKHWQEILDFLKIFGNKWNDFIKINNIISISEFKTKMIEFNTKFFENNKPINPIIFAGINSNIKGTCKLIQNLIKYDNCYFIFNGLDKELNEDEWKSVDIFHPQYSMKYILENFIQINRNQINNFEIKENILIDNESQNIFSKTMLPSIHTYKWQNNENLNKDLINHITKIECDNDFEEINIISYIIKYNVNTSNKTIGVITASEDFASKLELKLKSDDIETNNSFGNKLSKTEIIKFLFLIIDLVKEDFETTSLLSILKHKFSLFGYTKEYLNLLIIALENNVLRGLGRTNYKGIIKKINSIEDINIRNELNNFIKNIREYFIKILDFNNIDFGIIIKFHMEIAEKIASNNEINGYDIIWNNEDSNGIFEFFQELLQESVYYNKIENLSEYSNILNYIISENSYSDKYSIHPTVNIISPQESKLINYDLIIIPNLNEGDFPQYVSTDPWMSKSMRKDFNLPNKEESIGHLAYDFICFLNNKEVILTRSIKYNGVITIKSRYLSRLETFLSCQNLKLKTDTLWKEIFKKLNKIEKIKIIKRPKPTPFIEDRPKELYATDIEKLKNNPYDIYAKKILKLKKKDEFYDDKIFAVFGNAVHEAIEQYVNNYSIPKNIENRIEYLTKKFIEYGEIAFGKYFTNSITKELFFIRFLNIARWFIKEDEKIRNTGFKILGERTEKYKITNNFTISAKIDRIEENEFGIINICDYKTGNVPSNNDVIIGKKPQLTIEAIILTNKNKKVDNLIYWIVKGKDENKINFIKTDINSLLEKGQNGLINLITYFNVYENSYIASCYELNNKFNKSDFEHLSRVEEWGYL